MASPLDESCTMLAHSHETEQDPNRTKVQIFKDHKECSTAELFYDLFFVANLAAFSTSHEIVDGDCEIQIALV